MIRIRVRRRNNVGNAMAEHEAEESLRRLIRVAGEALPFLEGGYGGSNGYGGVTHGIPGRARKSLFTQQLVYWSGRPRQGRPRESLVYPRSSINRLFAAAMPSNSLMTLPSYSMPM